MKGGKKDIEVPKKVLKDLSTRLFHPSVYVMLLTIYICIYLFALQISMSICINEITSSRFQVIKNLNNKKAAKTQKYLYFPS